MIMSNHLYPIPVTRSQVRSFIHEHHRHHGFSNAGYRFAIGAMLKDELVGVAVVSRPSSRVLDDGLTAEVTRLCTDGTANACSFLYAACARACKAMGYAKLITYILSSEPGTSLRASGWKDEGPAGGGSWNCPSRPREDKAPTCPKRRFAICFSHGGESS